ncbi:MAG: NADPH-dependent 7-cyano-7-deazaguanine reductase QueF [Candidatus Omnitrophica bacterium]|nr:NADPH-dependent 7-cyano-7-deazaguanine reductase QueF [Candidatus Omnitrophota bacterium]
MPTQPSKTLEIITNPSRRRNYEIYLECPEFTCVCPKTGQPDFATIRITYIPDKWCIELKSLKLYLWSYRQEGIFHEAAVNTILDDIVKAIKPRRVSVAGDFYVRGGIRTVVTAEYKKRKKRTLLNDKIQNPKSK